MYAGKRDFNVEAEPEPLLQRGTKGFTKDLCLSGKLLMLNCSINLELVEDSNRNHVVLPKVFLVLVVYR